MVNILGVWLVIMNINYLYDDPEIEYGKTENRCIVVFNNATNAAQVHKHDCNEVAAEINKHTLLSEAQEPKP